MIRQDVRSVSVGEAVTLPFDFQKYLGAGVTIGTPTSTASLFSGVDPTPAGLLSGAPTVAGSVAKQAIVPTIAGNVYNVDVTVTTSDSQTLISETIVAVVQEPGL